MGGVAAHISGRSKLIRIIHGIAAMIARNSDVYLTVLRRKRCFYYPCIGAFIIGSNSGTVDNNLA